MIQLNRAASLSRILVFSLLFSLAQGSEGAQGEEVNEGEEGWKFARRAEFSGSPLMYCLLGGLLILTCFVLRNVVSGTMSFWEHVASTVLLPCVYVLLFIKIVEAGGDGSGGFIVLVGFSPTSHTFAAHATQFVLAGVPALTWWASLTLLGVKLDPRNSSEGTENKDEVGNEAGSDRSAGERDRLQGGGIPASEYGGAPTQLPNEKGGKPSNDRKGRGISLMESFLIVTVLLCTVGGVSAAIYDRHLTLRTAENRLNWEKEQENRNRSEGEGEGE
jgi:hypothetical protein